MAGNITFVNGQGGMGRPLPVKISSAGYYTIRLLYQVAIRAQTESKSFIVLPMQKVLVSQIHIQTQPLQ